MEDGTPARIERAALERIIRRAAELQAAEHDSGEDVTSEQLLALGREVGIPGRHLRQAMLEERTRIPAAPSRGWWHRLIGPAELVAHRVVQGDPSVVEQELAHWMEEHELLRVQRRQPGRVTWEPLGGVQAAIRRSAAAIGRGRRPFMLSRAETVSATVVGLDDGYSHVTLAAEAGKARRGYVGGGLATAATGMGAVAVLIALGAMMPVALIPIPVGLGIGYGIARGYGPAASRIRLGLECALDYLEHDKNKAPRRLSDHAGLLGFLADEVRKVLRP